MLLQLIKQGFSNLKVIFSHVHNYCICVGLRQRRGLVELEIKACLTEQLEQEGGINLYCVH